MDVELFVGETKTFRAALLKDDDSRDERYEDARYGYDGEEGMETAADGSSRITLDPHDALVVSVTGLAPSALDEFSQPMGSQVILTADSDEGLGRQIISGTLNVKVRDKNATHVVFDQIANPTPAPAEPKPAEPAQPAEPAPVPEPEVPPAPPAAEPVFPDPASLTDATTPPATAPETQPAAAGDATPAAEEAKG